MKLRHKIELLIFFLLQTTASSSLKTSTVIQKALHIADSVFEHNMVTSIVWFSATSDLEKVTQFIKKFDGTVVLTAMQKRNHEEVYKFNKHFGYKQTVFFAKGVDEFAIFIALLKPDTIIPIHLILVLTQPITNVEMSAITKTAWLNDLADIIILHTNDRGDIELTIYYPYKNGICGDHSPVQIKANDKKWFPKKFKNFQGCPVRVILIPMIPYFTVTIVNDTVQSIAGLDGRIFNMLMEKINATPNVVLCKNHRSIGSYINGTASGCFADLVYNRSDLFAPTLVLDHLRYPVSQISHVFQKIDMFWFGPPRRERDQWLRILQPYMTEVSQAVIGSFVLFIVVVNIAIRYGMNRIHFRLSVSFQSFIMFLGQEVKFESKSWLVNYLFVMWIWFCMIVRIVFQGDLVDGLQKTILEKPLTNFKEAVNEINSYGGMQRVQKAFNGTGKYPKYRGFHINDIPSLTKKVSNGMRFLLASEKLMTMELASSLQLLGPITSSFLCFYMRPGWPAAKEIDNVILHMTEAGFMQKVLNDHLYEWTKKKARHEERKALSLNMDTFIGCFYGLGFLYIICILVFIVEIIYYKLMFKPKKKTFFL